MGSPDSSRGPRTAPATDRRSAVDLAAYRAAVADLATELAGIRGRNPVSATEAVLTRRMTEPEFGVLLARTPAGRDASVATLIEHVHRFEPNPRSSAVDLPALVRVHLLSQIDVLWWQHLPRFETDADVHASPDLVDLEALRRRGRLEFSYRVQPTSVRTSVARAAMRRLAANRSPRTIGLRLTLGRPETVALLNQCAILFAKNAPTGTPPLWVNSLVRSVEYQNQMRSLGYAAVAPSAHCVGYAVDVEMAWFRRSGAHLYLQQTLLTRLAEGDVNVIDEGQAWHVCINPAAVAELRRSYHDEVGG